MRKWTFINSPHYTIAAPSIDKCVTVTQLAMIMFSDGQLTKLVKPEGGTFFIPTKNLVKLLVIAIF